MQLTVAAKKERKAQQENVLADAESRDRVHGGHGQRRRPEGHARPVQQGEVLAARPGVRPSPQGGARQGREAGQGSPRGARARPLELSCGVQ